MDSAWYDHFRADVRSSLIVRAVEASLGHVAAATAATATGTWAITTWTTAHLASASRSLGCAGILYMHVTPSIPALNTATDKFFLLQSCGESELALGTPASLCAACKIHSGEPAEMCLLMLWG